LAVGSATAVWLARSLRGLDRDFEALVEYRPGLATRIYASDGSLLARVAKENRIYVRLGRMPDALKNATVAAEDRRFYQHSGVDFRGVLRALWRDFREQRAAEGGSTLTMQLIRNIQLTPEKTMERKVREAALALRMERVYTKSELLEMYLNQVFYGANSYGVGAAARTYFGKSVARLSPAQCALLATLPRRPADFNPYRDPKGALQRRNALLKEMAEQSFLNSRQLAEALREPLGVKPRGEDFRYKRAPYFVDAVTDRLIDLYGPKTVYEGGLNVYTTLNPALQDAAEKSVTQGLRSLRGRNVSQAALVAIDPASGEIKALVGGADYRKSQFNRAVNARRQPGSSFKPFVYAAAMDNGVSPLDKITDGPVRLTNEDGVAWSPKDYDNRFIGQTTVVNAFAQSLNTPAVKLSQAAGIPMVADVARSCGIRSPLKEVPALALGASEVTPLELTAAYSVFANQGEWAEPRMIRRVSSADGTIDDSFGPRVQEVMDPSIAQKTDYLLRAVVENGTGKSVRSISRARGKTGTTQDDKDAWFVGYTPELVAGVWAGNDRPSPMKGVWGGTGCAPIWRRFMERALEILPKRQGLPMYVPSKPKPKPSAPAQAPALQANANSSLKEAPEWESSSTVEGDSASPTRVSEVKSDGSDLSQADDRVKIRICAETGLLAGPHCPETETEEVPRGMVPSVCDLHASRSVRLRAAVSGETTPVADGWGAATNSHG
jgi:penicillin-binding protein 1A